MSCTFCEFVSGERKEHLNGFAFKPLKETTHSLSFLSIDLPATEDGHAIVIPKQHFQDLEDVSEEVLADLIKHVTHVSKALRVNNEGTNLLLNNGKSAGQKLMHVHFHIIPRNFEDGIEIEVFDRKKISEEDFNSLFEKVSGLL